MSLGGVALVFLECSKSDLLDSCAFGSIQDAGDTRCVHDLYMNTAVAG
jgi:hypothetical protein